MSSQTGYFLSFEIACLSAGLTAYAALVADSWAVVGGLVPLTLVLAATTRYARLRWTRTDARPSPSGKAFKIQRSR
jgi:hypothetical protein